VHLNLVFEGDTFGNEELEDVPAVVSLKLNDGAPLVVLNRGSIAAPGLLERADHLLQVQVVRQSLHQREALSGRALLEVQMDKVVRFLLLGLVLILEVFLIVAAHLVSTAHEQDVFAVVLLRLRLHGRLLLRVRLGCLLRRWLLFLLF